MFNFVFEADRKLLPSSSKSREESQFFLHELTRVTKLHIIALRELEVETQICCQAGT